MGLVVVLFPPHFRPTGVRRRLFGFLSSRLLSLPLKLLPPNFRLSQMLLLLPSLLVVSHP